MKPRRLRIAVSVFFALVAIALCLVWCRSQSRHDSLHGALGEIVFQLSSAKGRLLLVWHTEVDSALPQWGFDTQQTYQDWEIGGYVFSLQRNTPMKQWTEIRAPIWPFLLGAVALGAWLIFPKYMKFSLRTMLIAITLIALALGLAVWATTAPKSPPIDHVDAPIIP